MKAIGEKKVRTNMMTSRPSKSTLNLLNGKRATLGAVSRSAPCVDCKLTGPLHCMDWQLIRAVIGVRGQDRLDDFTRRYALATGTPGHGQELVDTASAETFWQEVLGMAKLPQLFEPLVQMDTLEVPLPYELGECVFYKPSGEGQAVTATDLATGSKVLHAYEVKAQVDISDELADDALPLFMPSIKAHLVRKAARAVDDLCLNADTTSGTGNIDFYGAEIPASSRFLLGFDGLIHQALVDAGNKLDVGTLDATKFLALVAKLGKYAEEPERLAVIVDWQTYLKALGLPELRTLDRSEPVLASQAGTIYGVPVLVSSTIQKSDANGRIDGVTPGNNVKGRIVALHRDSWQLGYRKAFLVESERSASKGLVSLTISLRLGFISFGNIATATHTALGYNVTV